MNLEQFRDYCLTKPGVTEEYPFDGSCAWIKVKGKLFALTNVMEMKMGKEIVPPFHFINLKCDPERAIELRGEHDAIRPGWHQSKKHWNSLYMEDQQLPDRLVLELTDHSYELVVQSLPVKVRKELSIEN